MSARLKSVRGAVLCVVGATWTACAGGEPAGEAAVDEVVGRAPAAVGGVPSVIVLHPTSATTPPPPAGAVVMDQLSLSFSPPLLLARVGQPVRFTNSEPISHNVTVRPRDTDTTLLNVDMDTGGREELVLEDEGGYDVTCGIHPGMIAFVFATPGPYATFAETDGAYALRGVPPGSYRLEVWSADPERRSERSVEVRPGRTEVGPGSGG